MTICYLSPTMASQNGKKYISHKLSRVDTLVSLALKYSIPVGELKKENKLWNPDHLFLREQLLIPLTPDNENALDETDTIVVYSGSTAVSPSSPHPVLPNGSVPSTSYHVSSETEPVKASSKSHPNGSSSIPDSKKGGNPDDFFNKYDNSIARLKGDVAKMEKNAANLEGIIDANPLALPPRKGSTQSRRDSNSSVNSTNDRRGRFMSEEEDNGSPVLVIRSRTNNRHVRSTIESLEQRNDDLFEL
ncbi:lysM and putative peptidoglycan-binding domain-containing protein 1-like isoform X2 [Physella acuta]|uniref:lysM and putative peptidoglycan-binding domain-containing protein 1-like isoform X2 n=1 Tax=Physella acuta TaxID=109671 RepID=UPI0027DBAA9B|nr:lysM and putative peptidoglycan-binding domain-containing protein 1-like isoform X2 [Physella acuta]